MVMRRDALFISYDRIVVPTANVFVSFIAAITTRFGTTTMR